MEYFKRSKWNLIVLNRNNPVLEEIVNKSTLTAVFTILFFISFISSHKALRSLLVLTEASDSYHSYESTRSTVQLILH